MSSALVTGLVKSVRQPGRAFHYAMDKVRETLFWERLYDAMREPKVRGAVSLDPEAEGRILVGLEESGIAVERYRIDLADLEAFGAAARYDRFFAYRETGRLPDLPEKRLEHYLAAKLLGLGAADVVVDVASHFSPASRVYRDVFGCTTYRQDLCFAEGRKGDRFGGDAANMPVPDGFATALTLHNAFEHFEGDSDCRFIREAGRVLRPGGRMCIVPLFLADPYAIQCDPIALPAGGRGLEPDAVVWCARGWRGRHGRFYDVPHLLGRVATHLGPLRMRIVVLENTSEVHPACYARFAALFDRL